MKKYSFLFVFILFICFPFKIFASQNATDVLGQLDLSDTQNYTSNLPNNIQEGAKLLTNPQGGVFVDTTYHRLFIGDTGNTRVLVYNLNTNNQLIDNEADYVIGAKNFNTRFSPPRITSTGLTQPIGLFFDPISQYLFVSEYDISRVVVYDLSGGITNGMSATYVLGQPNFTAGVYGASAGLSRSIIGRAQQVAYDSANRLLFVVDLSNNRVMVYDLSFGITNGMNATYVLGQPDFTTVNSTVNQSGIVNPYGVVFDSVRKRLFVAQGNSVHRVSVFDLSSGITNGMNASYVIGQANFTSNSSALTQSGLNFPRHLDYDSVNDRLFVSDFSNHRVMVYDLSGGITNGMNASYVIGQANFTSNSSTATQSTAPNALGVGYDSTNNFLYVNSFSSNRTLVYDLSGGITNGMNATNVIGQYNSDGSLNYTKGTSNNGLTTNSKGLSSPQNIALDSTNNRLFVADSSNNRVVVYNLDVNNNISNRTISNILGQSSFTASATACSASGMNAPFGVVYDNVNNRLYVSDKGNKRVLVYDVASITNGEAAVNVLGQTNLTTCSTGVTQVLTRDPAGLVLDSNSNRLFVADGVGNRVVVYDVASITNGEAAVNVLGQAIFTTSTAATTVTGLSNPTYMTYDNSSKLYVTDQTNNRVIVYDVASITDGESAVNVLGQSVFTTSTGTTSQSGFNAPRGVTYDTSNSRLYVSDNGNNRILMFRLGSGIANGMNASALIGSDSFTSNYYPSISEIRRDTIYNPTGLYYDALNSKLYTAESNRVLIFNIIPLPSFSDSIKAGSLYTNNILASEGYALNRYSLSTGSIPDGISLSENLTGRPIVPGSYNFSIFGENFFSTEAPISLTVNPRTNILVFPSKIETNTTLVDEKVVSVEKNKDEPIKNNLSTSSYTFSKDLKLKSKDDDVKRLQVFLNSKGFTVSKSGAGSSGKESTLFGKATQNALIKFQKSKNITPANGNFGPKTRKEVNLSI